MKKLDLDILKELHKYLSGNEADKYLRFQRWQDAQSHLIGRIAVRNTIKELYNIDIKNLKFTENYYGKLFLVNNSKIHFNISHSGDWIVITISDNIVGIDIEKIININLKIIKRFFSNSEYETIKNTNCKDRIIHFYDL